MFSSVALSIILINISGITSSLPKVKEAAIKCVLSVFIISNVKLKNSFTAFGTSKLSNAFPIETLDCKVSKKLFILLGSACTSAIASKYIS